MKPVNAPYSPEYTQSAFEMSDDITEDGIFKGMGTVFDDKPDSGFFGDIIKPGAFQKTIRQGGRNRNGIVMLSQHGQFTMIPPGVWSEISETEKGLPLTGELFVDTSRHAKQGKGTELAHDMHVAMSAKALRGLSIGFDFPRNRSGNIKDGVVEFDKETNNRIIKEVILWEVSPVTFGMKVNANITTVKSIIEATTERELEKALKVLMLNEEAKYIVKLCKGQLREASNKSINPILSALKEVNQNMKGMLNA